MVGIMSFIRDCAKRTRIAPLVMACVFLITGCNAEGVANLSPAPINCDARCHQDALTLIGGGTTVSAPAEPDVTNRELTKRTLEKLIRKCESSGRARRMDYSQSMIDRLPYAQDGRLSSVALLITSQQHVLWFHGLHFHDDVRNYAVRHGRNGVALLTAQEFEELGIEEVCLFAGESGLSRSFGSKLSHLTVVPSICNVGLLDPFEAGETEATLINSGKAPIEIVDIETSCGCTVAKLENDTRRLGPGNRVSLRVSLSSRDAVSVRESVSIIFLDTEMREEHRAELDILAYQLPVMSVSQKELQFGPVRRGQVAQRSFRLSETRSDRFQLKSFDSRQMPVDFEVEQIPKDKGLRDHLVRCSWRTDDLRAGTHRQLFQIATSSDWKPTVEIPATITVLPDIYLSRSKLSFGTIVIGSQKTRQTEIVAGNHATIRSIRALNVRAGMNIEIGNISELSTKVPVAITWAPETVGEHVQVLLFRVQSSEGDMNLKLVCTANADQG